MPLRLGLVISNLVLVFDAVDGRKDPPHRAIAPARHNSHADSRRTGIIDKTLELFVHATRSQSTEIEDAILAEHGLKGRDHALPFVAARASVHEKNCALSGDRGA